MKICVKAELGQLKEQDATYFYEFSGKHFPICYIGKGTYTSEINIYSMLTGCKEDNVHFVSIGRYSSIGGNLTVLCNMNHDYRSVYQGVICEFADQNKATASYWRQIGQNDVNLIKKGTVIIGSDVWIGSDVTILSDVTIGDGAVIGTGSMVTKDVPPYAIVAGNPARVVKYRFEKDIVEKLERIQWWNFSKDEMLAAQNDMQGDVESFVSKYYSNAVYYSKTADNRRQTRFLAFMDIYSEYPTYVETAKEFSKQFDDGSAELIICYKKNDLMEENAAKLIAGSLPSNSNVKLSVMGIDKEEEERVICDADYLFVHRDQEVISRISYAFKYGIKCISSVDKPIFNQRVIEEIYCGGQEAL